MEKVNILGVNVDMVTIPQAADRIMEFFNEDRLHSVFTPNSEIIMAAYRDAEFCEILNNADLLNSLKSNSYGAKAYFMIRSAGKINLYISHGN